LFLALGYPLVVSCGCNTSQCASTETATMTWSGTAEELDGATATACRNDACQTVSLQPIATGEVEQARSPLPVLDPAPRGTQLSVSAHKTVQGFALTFVWAVFSSADIENGDILRVRLAAEDDSELFASNGAITDLHKPDADRCGDACSNASVSLE
jgi:hypothetical protein